MRTVMCIINGQLRPVVVRDRSIAARHPAAEKADRANPDHIAAPFAGVVTVDVDGGDTSRPGQTIATIEAMKMEAAITAPKAGTVARVAVSTTARSKAVTCWWWSAEARLVRPGGGLELAPASPRPS